MAVTMQRQHHVEGCLKSVCREKGHAENYDTLPRVKRALVCSGTMYKTESLALFLL